MSVREDWNTVAEHDLRPAGNGRDCFYCGEPLGTLHQVDCVIRRHAGWYHVAIRDNSTGEVRMYRNDLWWEDTDKYLWTEGNYACDCNRKLFFERAGGERGENDIEGTECGEEEFTCLYAKLPDGQLRELDEELG